MGVVETLEYASLPLESALDSPVLVIDTEGNGRDYRHDPLAKTMGISLAWRPGPTTPIQADYYPYYHAVGDNLDITHLDKVRTIIEQHHCVVEHNAKHDILALENVEIDTRYKDYYCTMMMGHFLNENMLNKGLDHMSQLYGGRPKARPKIMKDIIKHLGWEYIPSWLMREYSANDSFITYELFEKLLPDFVEEGYDGELWELEKNFTRLIMKMEAYGVRIDPDVCASEIEFGTKRQDGITRALNGLNANSPKDLEFLLFDALGLEPQFWTDNGRYSFDREAMEHYEEELQYVDDPTASLVLEYRGWLKAISAYYKAYLNLQSGIGNVHPNFKLHGTRTGRLSCERPNLQQIPRHSAKRWNGNAKAALRSREGYALWEADYSNLEFRLGALYANERNMIDPLVAGFKPFDAMAELLYGQNWSDEQRQGCKVFTYMTAYGAGIAKIAKTLGKDDEWATRMRSSWFGAYPGMRDATRRATRKADQRGYALLWSGRRRHFDGGKGTHKAFNAVIQGGAAELVKRVMLLLDEVIDWQDCKMLLQVHDSIVFEIRLGTENYWIPIIKTIMESVSVLHPKFATVPFPVEVKRWNTKEVWGIAA